jgi:hypothetical protein
MAVVLISPLGVEECRSRLESAGETGSIACSVRGRIFTLQRRQGRSASFLRGEFAEGPAGTVITFSSGTHSPGEQAASLWFKAGLPIFLLFAAALFVNGYVNGFTRNLSFGLVLALAVPAVFSTLKLRDLWLARREQKELLAFLQATLNGKYENRP